MKKYLLIILIISSTTSLSLAQQRKKVLFLGASIVAGFGIEENERISAIIKKLANDENLDLTFLNNAVSGASTNHSLSQFQRSLSDGFVPDYLFIGLGISDAVYQISPEKIKQNLKAVILKARKENPDITLFLFKGKIFQRHVTSRVPAKGSAYAKAYEQAFEDIGSEEKVILLPFILESIEGKMNYFQRDEIHPNALGMHLVAESIWQWTKKYF